MIDLVIAQAADPSADSLDITGQTIMWLISGFRAHNFWPAVAVSLMLLVWVVKHFLEDKLNSKVLPWVSMGAGVISGMAMNMLAVNSSAPSITWLEAMLHGALLGAAASGLYAAIGQHVEAWLKSKLGKKDQPPSA